MNIFVRHTFSMSKSSIETKTVLTMTDMTESTELLAFKRQKDGYKVTVKISLCICVVLTWDELKVRQNLLASDYEIYILSLFVATVYWHKSLQFVKKSSIILSPHLLTILWAVSMIKLWHINSKMDQPPNYQEMGFFPLFAYLWKPTKNYCIQKTTCPDP